VTLDWLARFLNLPEGFLSTSPSGTGGGVIQGTASEACLVAMLAARTRALRGRKHEDVARLVAYTTDQAHSCVKKACAIAGIAHLRLVPARAERDWAVDPADLEAAMAADEAEGLIPFFLTALIGTTSSAAVDPVPDLAAVAAKHSAWEEGRGGGNCCLSGNAADARIPSRQWMFSWRVAAAQRRPDWVPRLQDACGCRVCGRVCLPPRPAPGLFRRLGLRGLVLHKPPQGHAGDI
jgi:Pyridoxal-dependent decarboxylase conserved domain